MIEKLVSPPHLTKLFIEGRLFSYQLSTDLSLPLPLSLYIRILDKISLTRAICVRSVGRGRSMARTNRIRILNAVASSSFIYRRPTITILVRITASRKGEERAGNDRRYAPCIAGRGHDSVDWIDFRKAGTMVVSERNWIASGCSPDKKRIVSIRRRRENGNRRGNGGGEEVLQKKKDETRFRGTKSFPLFPSPPLPLFPADAFDSIAFDLPFDSFFDRCSKGEKAGTNPIG